MPRKQVLDAEKVKNQLGKIAILVERGEMSTKTANCLATVWKGCLYAIQIQNKEEDTEIARQLLEKQDEILNEVKGGNKPRLIDLKEGVD